MKKFRIVGNILMVVALFFVLRRLRAIDWSTLTTGKNLVWFILFVLLYAAIVIISFFPWRILVGVFTGGRKELNRHHPTFCYVFTKANILKYVPGNVFQYVGRNEIASLLQLDHVNVAAATAAEILLMTASALLCSLVLIGSYTKQYLRSHLLQILLLVTAAVALLALLLFLLYRRKKESFLQHFHTYLNILRDKNSVLRLLFCFVIYLLIFLSIGALFLSVVKMCGNTELPASVVSVIVGAFILSWLAGYLTPGAPGGIGIRELIMTLVFSENSVVSLELIIAASAVYRIINTLGDILAFLFALLLRTVHDKRNNIQHIPEEDNII